MVGTMIGAKIMLFLRYIAIKYKIDIIPIVE